MTKRSKGVVVRASGALAVLLGLLAGDATAGPQVGNPTVTLEQCLDGPLATPRTCTGVAWAGGNASQSTAHWYEGDSVPVRARFSALTTGVSHVVTFAWATTKQGRHAYDYLTRFDRSDAGADPCSGVSGCSLASYSTLAVPTDPMAAGSITQVPGEFVLFGGTLQSVSAYALSGSYGGDSTTQVSLTFTPSVAAPVLAFSAHIASRGDWGPATNAMALTGSPYLVRPVDLDGQSPGAQDRTLASAAVYGPSLVVTAVVVNSGGAGFIPSDFTLQVSGGDVFPASFAGAAAPGTVVLLAPGDYRVRLATPGYGATYSPDCRGTITARLTPSCTVTIDTDVLFADNFDTL